MSFKTILLGLGLGLMGCGSDFQSVGSGVPDTIDSGLDATDGSTEASIESGDEAFADSGLEALPEASSDSEIENTQDAVALDAIDSASDSVAEADGPCFPHNCKDDGVTCGWVDDGCGAKVQCPHQCTSPDTCEGGGVKNRCGCTPKTQAEACEIIQAYPSAKCGPASDTCGGTHQCPVCAYSSPYITCVSGFCSGFTCNVLGPNPCINMNDGGTPIPIISNVRPNHEAPFSECVYLKDDPNHEGYQINCCADSLNIEHQCSKEADAGTSD